MMDDLTKVREFREDVPPMSGEAEESVRRGLRALACGQEPAPRAAAGADGRAGGRSGRRLPGGRLAPWALPAGALAAAGVVAGGVVAGAVVLNDSGEPAHPPRPTAALPAPDVDATVPMPHVRLAGAVELGDRAAEAAERQPYRKPGPKQWIYTRSVHAGGFDMSAWWKGVDVTTRETNEQWKRADGGGHAHYYNGELKVRLFEQNEPGVRYRTSGPLFHLGNYDTLPTEPDALLRRLSTARYPDQVGETSAQDVFEFMEQILRDPSPPKLRAAVYRALPKVEGVTLRKGVRDAAGRPGVAFARVDELGERTSIILDPETYAYLGTREDVARAHTWRPENGKPFTTEPGTVLSWYAELTQKVVDEPGSRS